jgi:sensor domain CHASE-containing protein
MAVAAGLARCGWSCRYDRPLAKPALQALEWVDPAFYVRWVVPLPGNEAIVNQPSAPEARRRQALDAARATREPAFTQAIELLQGGRGVLVYVPLFRGSPA